ncbi:hypothetical protein CTKZ_07070 [Cellulomonas algicola]|uniref:Uncharacterized protein n=1 Tax=Cellulomonas algicola TaxID=2071633 RepID=A0A401UWT8_9CELL|nr:hypothetical protein [Cellulomonas algicola]GCD19145.1 hypothetical protein CTKZ_07070 [Cellulomonas algicola]
MLPSQIRTATVRLGPFLDDLGSPWTGRVTVRSSAARVWDASGATVHPRPAVVALDEHGGATLRLPTTDQPGFSDGAGRPVTSWSYTVTLELDGEPPVRHTFPLPGDEGDDVRVIIPVTTAEEATAAAPRDETAAATTAAAPGALPVPGDPVVAAGAGRGLTRRAAFRAGAMVLGTAAAVVAGQQGAAAAPARGSRVGSVLLPAAQTIDDDLVVGSAAHPHSLFIRSSAAGGTEGGPGIFDSTGRLVLETYQPHFQHFGESIRVELKDPRAKGMLTYRAAWPTPHYPDGDFTWVAGHPNGPQSVAWLGAHFLNNDDPSSLAKNLQHGHIGFEVPDSLGQLQTRLEIKFIDPVTGKIGTDKTAIRTNMADFEVGTSQRGEQLRVVGGEENHRDVVWATRVGTVREPRWVARTVAGRSNFELLRYQNGNVLVDTPFGVDRATGLVTVGGQRGTSAGLRVVRNGGIALTVTPLEAGGHGALVTGVDATTRAYQSDVTGDAQRRFVTLVDGTQQWGTGAAARDTQLYRRAVNQLGTDGGLFLRSSATPATASTGGVLFVADGALKFRGSTGTVTTLAPA